MIPLEKDVTGQKIVVYATNVADHFSPRPDMPSYSYCYISKNGSVLVQRDIDGTWSNLGAGFYAITLTADDVDTVGPLILYIYGYLHPEYCDPIRALYYVRERTEANVKVSAYDSSANPAALILADSSNLLLTDSSGRVTTTDGGLVSLADGSIKSSTFDGTTAYPQTVANPATLILLDSTNLLFTDSSGNVRTSGADTSVYDIVSRIQFTPEDKILSSFEGEVPTAEEIATAIMDTAVDGTVDVATTLKRLLAIGSGKITVENGNIYRFYAVNGTEEVFSVIINQFTRTPL